MSWTPTEHVVNAAAWATLGTYVANNYGSGLPQVVVIFGVALVISYGTDYFFP